MATKKRKKRRKTTTSTRRKRSTTGRRRTKKEQERLQREILSSVLIIIALGSLAVMFKNQGELGYDFKQILVRLFGWGAYGVSIVTGFIGLLLLFPKKLKERLNELLLFGLLAVLLLGLFELGLAKQSTYSFSVDQTRGGILGFALDRILLAVVGPFLTGLLQVGGILILLLLLTRLSIQEVVHSIVDFGQNLYDQISESFWQRIDEKEAAKQKVEPVIRKMSDDTEEEIVEELKDSTESTPEEKIADIKFEDQGVMPTPTSFEETPVEDEQTQALQEASSQPKRPSIWFLPTLDMLQDAKKKAVSAADPKERGKVIEETLLSFGVEAYVREINVGPTVTQYALEPATGVKVSKITGLQNDLALALATPRIRIEAPIPGKPYVGIEVPNYTAATVTLKGMLQSSQYQQSKMRMPVALGRDVSGETFFADLVQMPHVLIAGATGSGKSVCINSVIASILFRYNPDQVKLIMVDPKVVELSGYNGIPHLLTPVIHKPQKMLSSLKWAISEMEKRYRLFSDAGARNIAAYNQKKDELLQLPYIVIIVDELADLMLASPVEVEESICRLAQMSRATGIHLVVATQRPSVDVVTGLIKANIPARIAFAVASQMDSRVILDQGGAEKLLGKGDMLYHAPDVSKLMRLQGVFVSDQEIDKLVDFWKKQGSPEFVEEVVTQEVRLGSAPADGDYEDELLPQALEEIVKEGRASASLLQRRLSVGYARAARLIDILEERGVVGPADGSKPRDILRRSLTPMKPIDIADDSEEESTEPLQEFKDDKQW